MLVNAEGKTLPATTLARAARELAAQALERSGKAGKAAAHVDPDGFWPLDYHAWLAASDDGERMALEAARGGVGGGSLATKRTRMALECDGELRPLLAARGRELAEEAAAAGLARGCRDANWRRRYVDRYVTTAAAKFFLTCEEPEVLALQARAEGMHAAPQFGLTGRDWLN